MEDWRDKPFDELTEEEIRRLKEEEANEAPSTAQKDKAWSYNQTFTGVRLTYSKSEDYLRAMAERANLYAEDYAEKRKAALHFIATQKLFDFDKPVDNFVMDIIKSLCLSKPKDARRAAADRLSSIVYPVARRMIPLRLLDAYRMYPETFVRMEGLHLYDCYVGLDGDTKGYNAWIELDLPACLTSQDIHDELERMSKANKRFAIDLSLAIRRAHRAALSYRRKSFKTLLKMKDIKSMTYGGFANKYPVTFHGVCDYITNLGLNRLVEENASLHGALAIGETGLITRSKDVENETIQG